MKMTVATAVYRTATSDVTQALVKVYTTPALVDAPAVGQSASLFSSLRDIVEGKEGNPKMAKFLLG